jgi:hypothetical protein
MKQLWPRFRRPRAGERREIRWRESVSPRPFDDREVHSRKLLSIFPLVEADGFQTEGVTRLRFKAAGEKSKDPDQISSREDAQRRATLTSWRIGRQCILLQRSGVFRSNKSLDRRVVHVIGTSKAKNAGRMEVPD